MPLHALFSDLDDTLAVNLSDFTDQDGTDDTTGWNNAMTAAALLGTHVVSEGGTIRLDGVVTLVSGVSVVTEPGSTTLDFSHRLTYGTEAAPLLAGRGTRGASKVLSGNHIAGVTTITTVAAHGLVAGDQVLISSDRMVTGDASPNEHGEQGIVLEVPTPTTVVLSNGLCDFYNASDNAYLQEVTPIRDVLFKGFTIIGKGTPPPATPGDWGIRFEYGRNCHVTDCRFDGVDQCCVELLSVYEGSIQRNTYNFGKTPDELNVQYGSRVANASQYIVASDNHQTNGRHGFNCGHDYAHPGVQRFIICEDSSATGTWHAGFSTHNSCEHVVFRNNLAVGCRYGVNLRAKHCSAIGNEIRSCGTGVVLTVKPEYMMIDNNNIWGCDAGIGMTGTMYQDPSSLVYHEPEFVQISRNRIHRCPSGISLSMVDSVGTKRGWRIENNTITITTLTRAISINGPFQGRLAGNDIFDVQDDTNGDGIRLRGTREMVIENNTVDGCGAYGIRLLTIAFNGALGTAESVGNIVKGNRVRNCGTEGAVVDSSTTGTNIIEVRPRELAPVGATDFYAAIQACFNVGAVNGWTVRFDPGNYPITDTPVLTANNVTILATGATIDGSAIAAAVALSTRFALKVQGGLTGSGLAATATLPAGDKIIDIPTATLVAGDFILVASSTQLYMDGVTGATEVRQEIRRVLRIVSGTQAELTEALRFAYLTGATTTAKKINMVTGTRIQGLRILMGGDTKVHNGILFTNCYRPETTDVTVGGCEDTGLQFSGCWGGRVYGGEINDADSPPGGVGTTGYGVTSVDADRGLRVTSVKFRNCRHATASGTCASDFVTEYCFAEGCGIGSGSSFDCHEATFDCFFDHNYIDGALSGGIGLRGQGSKARWNTIRNVAGHGVLVKSFDTNTEGLKDIEVIGNDITGSGGAGVRSEGTTLCRVVGLRVAHNRLENSGLNNFTALLTDALVLLNNEYDTPVGSANDGNNVRLVGTSTSDRCTDVVISGGTFRNAPLRWLKADFTDGLSVTVPYIWNQANNTLITSCTRTRVFDTSGPEATLITEVPTPNSNFTCTILVDPEYQLHSGTLTADRTCTLSKTQNMYEGAHFRIVRTGGGAFNLNVLDGVAGSTIKGLATNTWGKFLYDGTNWKLVAYGTL